MHALNLPLGPAGRVGVGSNRRQIDALGHFNAAAATSAATAVVATPIVATASAVAAAVISTATAATVIAAIRASQAEWTDCDGRLCLADPSDPEEVAGQAAAEERARQAAASAAAEGDDAIAALEAGDWRAAFVAVSAAASIEREYGDTPSWGPVVQAVAAGWLRAEPGVTAEVLTRGTERDLCELLERAADDLAEDGEEGIPLRCECHRAIGVDCGRWTAPADRVTVEWMPEHLRESHRTAGNSGCWPHNGALRLSVDPGCADAVSADDAE